jgi:hypothetical protein
MALWASCMFILGACAESPTEAKAIAGNPPSTGYDAGGVRDSDNASYRPLALAQVVSRMWLEFEGGVIS